VIAVRPAADALPSAAGPYGTLVAVGLSHRTATVALRERAALTEPSARALLGDLRSTAAVSAAAVLSTCNRTELYAIAAAPGAVEALREALAARGRLDTEAVAAAGYACSGRDALTHLFRVTAGLDSLVVGEPEIQHQVRRAADVAGDEGTLRGPLREAFRHALAAGRRVRRETAIGRGAVSTASVGVELTRRALGDLHGKPALVVGAGAMASSMARALARHGVEGPVVCNRTPAAGQRLAAEVGGRAAPLGALPAELERADLVVACTGAPEPVLRRRVAARALARRGGRPLVCLDLAMPRDVEPAVASLDGVILFDVDDLRVAADANRSGRALEARRAEAIVAAEVARCLERARGAARLERAA
jgi:glutamyl-tRNA reductase